MKTETEKLETQVEQTDDEELTEEEWDQKLDRFRVLLRAFLHECGREGLLEYAPDAKDIEDELMAMAMDVTR